MCCCGRQVNVYPLPFRRLTGKANTSTATTETTAGNKLMALNQFPPKRQDFFIGRLPTELFPNSADHIGCLTAYLETYRAFIRNNGVLVKLLS